MKTRNHYQPIAELIKQKKTFLLLPHVNIDGDDLGSMAALNLALQKLGKKVHLYSQDEIPAIYQFLSGVSHISKTLPPHKVDVVMFMECSKISRAGEDLDFSKIAGTTVNLDHHPDNTFFADYNWVEPKYCALGELVYQLIKALKVPLDEAMATGIYSSIMADTGNLQFGNISRRTFQILAELMKLPIDTGEISRQIFRQKNIQVLKLFGLVASQLQRSDDGKIVWSSLKEENLLESGLKFEELQNFVEDLNQIAGSDVVVLFKELSPKEIRVNLRSRCFPVNKLAARFGGGGHVNAAGCTIYDDLKNAERTILEAINSERKILC